METNPIQKYDEYLDNQQMEELEKNKDLVNDFTKYAKSFGIKLIPSNFDFIPPIGIVVEYPNIVLNLLKTVHSVDKEGLFSWDFLTSNFKKRHSDGFLFSDNFMLMAHPFFRRGMNKYANFAPRFINIFWNEEHFQEDTSIAIDLDRLRINIDDYTYKEADTWYGAKFNKDINLIKDGLVKIRPPIGYNGLFYEIYFKNNYSLDILWTSYGTIKEIQLEEIKDKKVVIYSNGIQYHPVRYIHAEYDGLNRKFRHFDGAVHLYTETEYYQRKDSNLFFNNKNEKQIKPKSVKLFKINYNIDVDFWIKYCSHFLTGDPLVCEYFDGKYPDYINSILERGNTFFTQ